jgi:hypothetical protein
LLLCEDEDHDAILRWWVRIYLINKNHDLRIYNNAPCDFMVMIVVVNISNNAHCSFIIHKFYVRAVLWIFCVKMVYQSQVQYQHHLCSVHFCDLWSFWLLLSSFTLVFNECNWSNLRKTGFRLESIFQPQILT